jgi:hypothetical protein
MRSQLFFVTLLAVMALTATGHSHGNEQNSAGHSCAHNTISEKSKLYTIPQQRTVSLTNSHERAFEAQTAWPPAGWHPIRLLVNYTFADDPSLDVYPDGAKRACTALEEIPIGGEVDAPTTKCIDPTTGQLKYSNFCWLTCRPEDLVNKTSLSQPGSILQTLKTTINRILTRYQLMLAVPDTNPDKTTIYADKTVNNCGDLLIPSTDVLQKDFVMFVTLRPLQMLGSTLAFARACALDSTTSRPILGHTNVAPSTLINNRDLETVLMHEFTHAFGYSPSLFKFLRHPTNRSATYYQANPSTFPTGPVRGTGIVNNGNGDFNVDYRLLGPGLKLWLITPNLVNFARTYFNCPGMTGVELENGGASPASTASHWEKRILYYEYMTATQNLQPGTVSGFTLSYFQDTGFYEVNFTAADNTMTWGKGEGCPWVNNTCGSSWDSRYLCTTFQTQSQAAGGQCGYDRKWSGACNLVQFTEDLPAPYQYIVGQPKAGGFDEYADRCPIVTQFADSGDGRGNCLNPNNSPNSNNYLGLKSGINSRCFMSGAAANNRVSAPISPGCYEIICVNSVPQVRIADAYYPCRYSGESFELLQQTRAASSTTVGSTSNANPLPPTSTLPSSYLSYSMKGVFQCGLNINAFCDGSIQSVSMWPNISSVTPTSGTTDGGTLVTVTGVNLHLCYGITLGGQWVTNITKISSAIWTVSTPAAGSDSKLGGPGSDGTGPTMLELWCNLTNSCPNGCATGRLQAAFNYTTPDVVPFSATDWLMNFFATPLGKAVGGGVGAILLILLIIVIKSCCEGGSDKKGKKGKKGKGRKGQTSHQKDLELGSPSMVIPQRGPAYPPPYSPQGPGGRTRMQQYEDELL